MRESDGEIKPDQSQSAPPTGARWVVLGFLCALSAILYMDRICFSKAVTSLENELHLSKEDISWVMVAFTISYGIFEIPVGRWGDRIGPRRVLPRIAVCWSLFTALTGACFGFWQLIVVRFLFGVGEAGAYPNSARVLARWFPDSERARAQGLLLAASQFGLIVSMPIAALLVEVLGWRSMFVFFGSVGVVWAVVFFLWFRDDPGEHERVNPAERRLIGKTRATAVTRHDPIPWRLVSTNRSIWVLCGTMNCGAFNSYFYFSWFPRYLEQARSVSNLQAGWLTSALYIGGAMGMLAGGVLAGQAFRQTANRDAAIRLRGGLGYIAAACCLWLAIQCDSSVLLAALAAVSYALTATTQPLWWSCATNVTGRHIGSLFGLMNMSGLLGAAASQSFVGYFTGWRERLGHTGRDIWDPVFNVYIGMLLLGGFCWAVYRTRNVEPDESNMPSNASEEFEHRTQS